MAEETNSNDQTKVNLSTSEIDGKVKHCISNLKILAKIKPKDKLYYQEDKFWIDEPKYLQGVSRWWNEGSRKETLKSLGDFADVVFRTIDAIYNTESSNNSGEITNTYYSNIASNAVFKEENSNLLIQFTQEMNNAASGLSNLKATYKDDITTVSSLEIIIEKFNVRVNKINSILSISSKK